MITVRSTEIPSYLRRSAFYVSLDKEQGDDDLLVPAQCLWPGGEISDEIDFRCYLLTLQFWGVDYLTQDGLKYCFQLGVNDSYSTVRIISAMQMIADVVDVKSSLYICLRTIVHEIHHIYSEIEGRVHIPTIISFDSATLSKVLPSLLDSLTQHEMQSVICSCMAGFGQLEDLKELHQHYNHKGDARMCARAAGGGHLDCLEYLVTNNCPCDSSVCSSAAYHGHVHILQYLHSNKLGCTNSNTWSPEVASAAARGGQIRCLEFIYTHNYPWDKEACAAAAMYGHLDCVKYLHERFCPWEEQCCNYAANIGNLAILQYLHENDCPWGSDACNHAARAGRLSTLKYLRENGCPWSTEGTYAATAAATYGKADTLRYCIDNGCQYDDHILVSSAHQRSLECLKYLIEDQGLYMHEGVFYEALFSGDIDSVVYLIDTGCPYQDTQFLFVMPYETDADEFFTCMVYAIERGWIPNERFFDVVRRETKYIRCKEYLLSEGLFV